MVAPKTSVNTILTYQKLERSEGLPQLHASLGNVCTDVLLILTTGPHPHSLGEGGRHAGNEAGILPCNFSGQLGNVLIRVLRSHQAPF